MCVCVGGVCVVLLEQQLRLPTHCCCSSPRKHPKLWFFFVVVRQQPALPVSSCFFSPSGFLEILRPCHCWPLGDKMVKGLAHPQGCKTRLHKEQSQRRASSVKVCWVPLGKNGFFKSCSYAFWESYRFLFYSVCIVLHVCQTSFTRIPVYSLRPGTLLGVRCAA